MYRTTDLAPLRAEAIAYRAASATAYSCVESVDHARPDLAAAGAILVVRRPGFGGLGVVEVVIATGHGVSLMRSALARTPRTPGQAAVSPAMIDP